MGLKDLKEKIEKKKTEEAGGIMGSATEDKKKHKQLGLEIKLPGMEDFKPLGRDQYSQIYADDIGPRLLCVIDEVAELLEPSGVKTQEGKEEDSLKQEITMLIKSITQLGRSSGMHIVLAPLSLDTIIPLANGGFKTMLTIKQGDFVYDLNGKPTKVLNLSAVKESETLYKIQLTNSNNHDKNIIEIKSDKVHRFPILINFKENENVRLINSKKVDICGKECFALSIEKILDLRNKGYELKFTGINGNEFDIVNIEIVQNELVRCIEVESDEHLFVINGFDNIDLLNDLDLNNDHSRKMIDIIDNLIDLNIGENSGTKNTIIRTVKGLIESGEIIRKLNYIENKLSYSRNSNCERSDDRNGRLIKIEERSGDMNKNLKSVDGQVGDENHFNDQICDSSHFNVDDQSSNMNKNLISTDQQVEDDSYCNNQICDSGLIGVNDRECVTNVGHGSENKKVGDECKEMNNKCVASILLTHRKMLKNNVLCFNTQRNDASIIPGVIQNNPLDVETKMLIKHK